MTFAPCFMFVFAGAPFMERLRSFTPLHSALTGIGAAVTGVIASLAVLFMTSTLFAQWPALSSLQPVPLIIALIALLLVFVLKRGTPTVLITSCVLGVVSGWLPLS
jgi:chromate transporter